jgi:hypothetical protein
MDKTCALVLKGCDTCTDGVKLPNCNEVLCGEPATQTIWGEDFCDRHAAHIQALKDRREKGTPLPADYMEQWHENRRRRGLED